VILDQGTCFLVNAPNTKLIKYTYTDTIHLLLLLDLSKLINFMPKTLSMNLKLFW